MRKSNNLCWEQYNTYQSISKTYQHRQIYSKNYSKSKTTASGQKTHKSLQQLEKADNTITMPSTLQFEQRKYPNN